MIWCLYCCKSFAHVLCRDVDKVHDLMDDVAEQQEIANEISDAISNPVGFNTDMDEVCSPHSPCSAFILIYTD